MQEYPIKNFEGYTITKSGQVFSYKFRHYISEKYKHEMHQSPRGAKSNYISVSLSKNSKTHHADLHRLLAQTFLENPENLPVVRHIDGNSKNNSLLNLAWSTYKENSADRKIHNTNYGARGINQHCAKLNPQKIKLIRLLRDNFKWSYNKIAKLPNINVDYKSIWNIANRVTWSYAR